jgi:hypothetical protein
MLFHDKVASTTAPPEAGTCYQNFYAALLLLDCLGWPSLFKPVQPLLRQKKSGRLGPQLIALTTGYSRPW